MFGFFSGVVLAVWYRNEGPQKPVYEWLEEEEDESGGTGEEENGGMEEEENVLRYAMQPATRTMQH